MKLESPDSDESPLDSHADLNRLKVSALLGALHGSLGVTEEDWRLGGILMETSGAVREEATRRRMAERHHQAANRDRQAAGQAVIVEAAKHDQDVRNAIGRMQRKLQREGRPMTRRELSRASASLADVIEDALHYALMAGILIEVQGGFDLPPSV
jgi:hypothetical protein